VPKLTEKVDIQRMELQLQQLQEALNLAKRSAEIETLGESGPSPTSVPAAMEASYITGGAVNRRSVRHVLT